MDNKEAKTKDQLLADWTYVKFKESMVNKEKITRLWQDCIDAYNGDYFKNDNRPDYKSDEVSNMIFSIIEAIRPIMADNNCRFEVFPRTQRGSEVTSIVQKALDYEFDREEVSTKLLKMLITVLQVGTGVLFVPWNGDKGIDGEVNLQVINPFNLYPDPLATSVEDAEYIIYATYMHVNQLKQAFPGKANLLEGGNINYTELVANRGNQPAKTDTQVLVLETWCRDYTYIDIEEDKNGEKVKTKKRAYPNGRVITTAPELGVVLGDKENPYKDGKFPFIILKDIDVPFEFWGKGEVEQLLSPQKYINELTNQIIDNAKTTANMQWIIDKNSGIQHNSLTNRPGLVIRKNPGSEVRRDNPPPMPSYVRDMIESLKMDIENISGVHDATQGRRPTGIQAGNAILALQEAGQSRIRLKVKLLERTLGELAQMWYSRMKQFWMQDRWIRVSKEEGGYEFIEVNRKMFEEEFDIKITSGSTMTLNKSAMLDLMIRLAQTTAQDGLPMVDRETVLEFAPVSDKKELLKRMESITQQQQEQQAQILQQQLQEQGQMFAGQLQQLNEAIVQVAQTVQELNKDVDKIEAEHEAIKQEEKLSDLEATAFEKGAESVRKEYEAQMRQLDESEALTFGDESDLAGLTDIEVGAMENAPGELDDDFIEELLSMDEEELMKVMELYPELQQMVEQQLSGMMPQQNAMPQQMMQQPI